MDIETYMREARRFDNHRPETMLDALAHGLMAEVGEVAEGIAYGDFGNELVYELGDVAWNLIRLADELDMEPDDLHISDQMVVERCGRAPADVMQVNINKLTARYAERGLPVKEAS